MNAWKWRGVIVLLLVAVLSGCGTEAEPPVSPEGTPPAEQSVSPTPTPTPPPSATPSETPSPEVTPEPTPVKLVEYAEPVDHLFFHPLLAYPERAFDGEWNEEGLDDWFVTVPEYQKILQSLYDKGFVLVDINECFEEETGDDGKPFMRGKTLLVPEGKKPIVLSFDDVNYYEYMRKDGTITRLVLDTNGQVVDESVDANGQIIFSRERDIVTILDAFVEAHPDFSINGAKGVLGLTGYEGILGYRTHRESPNRQAEIEAVKPVVARLKETGWVFASHSYGHPHMDAISDAKVAEDTKKWKNEVEPLVGATQVLIYPYGGAVPADSPKMKTLVDAGFRVLCPVGIEAYYQKQAPGVISMDRRHADGITLRHQRKRYLDLYDALDVIDLAARPDRPVDFTIQ